MPKKHTMDDMVPKKRGRPAKPKHPAHSLHKEKEEILIREEEEKIEDEKKERYIDEETSVLGLSPRPRREPLNASPLASSRRSKGRFGFWLLAAVFVVLGLMYATTFFTRVTATITPKVKKENITAGLRLGKREPGLASASSTLYFDIFSVPKETAEETLETTGVEKVSKKASGDITIINLYSKTPVSLVANTRFQAPNGNIYRIKDQVEVPGMKTQKGTSTPAAGIFTVKVYADKPGPSYNIKLTDFTIPGFKGSPQYAKVYARSKTEISGGFEGESAAVSESSLSAARERLKADVLDRLNKRQSVEVPAGYFVIPEAAGISWDEKQTVKNDDPKKVVLSVSGEITGLLVKKEDLGSLLLGEEGYTLTNAEKLDFKIENGNAVDIKTFKTGLLKASGPGVFVANVPEGAIAAAMLGKKKSELEALFKSYPSVEKAKIMFFPLWAKTVPNDPNRVTTEANQDFLLDE